MNCKSVFSPNRCQRKALSLTHTHTHTQQGWSDKVRCLKTHRACNGITIISRLCRVQRDAPLDHSSLGLSTATMRKSRSKMKPGPKCPLLLGDSERTVRVRSTIRPQVHSWGPPDLYKPNLDRVALTLNSKSGFFGLTDYNDFSPIRNTLPAPLNST